MPMYGVQFGMDGLTLDGTTWYNPKTNDVIKIRSNYFEDNVMKLQCNNGRMLTLEQLSDYVQWTGKGEPPRTPIINTPTPNSVLPPEVSSQLADSTSTQFTEDQNDILPEDLELIQTRRINLNNPNNNQINLSASYSTNYNIINRALNKTLDPSWDISMKWDKFPKKEIELLSSVMDISLDEIADYYFNKMKADLNTSFNNIKTQIKDCIFKKMEYKESVESTPEATQPTKKTSKRNVK